MTNDEIRDKLTEAYRRIENLERSLEELHGHLIRLADQTCWTRPLDAAHHFRRLSDEHRIQQATDELSRLWRPS